MTYDDKSNSSVLVVDDAEVIRRTVTNFLKTEPGIKVLGEASNFQEAISMTAALRPDAILLDLHMPDDRSFNPEFVKAGLSGARVLAMSLSSDYETEEETRRIVGTRQSCAMNWFQRFCKPGIVLPAPKAYR